MSWLRVQQTALLSVYCRRHSRKKTEALGPYRTGVSQQSHPPRLGALTCSTHTTSWHITCQNHMSVLMESSGWSAKHIVSGIVITGQGWVQTMNDSCAPHSSLTLIRSDRGPWKGPQTLCSGWELTHQGSRNMVATLNPIRTHILMKTSRLLGTQATIITAGMKSWERQKRGFKVWNISLIIKFQRSYRQSDENSGLFPNSQKNYLPHRNCYRGRNLWKCWLNFYFELKSYLNWPESYWTMQQSRVWNSLLS